MEPHIPTRQEAYDLLREFNTTDKALKHALTVEAATSNSGASSA